MARSDGPLALASAAIFCAILISIVFGRTSLTTPHTLYARQNPTPDKPNCTTKLAPDLYGLGVRLGIYFQWLSGWMANNFIVDEVAGALDANAIFLFALLIAIVNSTKTDELTQIDGMVILQLCSGTIWSCLSIWGYRTIVYKKEGLDGIRRFGGFGTHLRLLLIAATGSYGIWYWRIGTKGLPAGLDDYGDVPASCHRRGITVLTIPIQQHASAGGLALSSAALVYSGLMTLVAPLTAVTRIMKMLSFARTKSYASSTRLRYATGASKEQLIVASRVFGIANFLWIIFIMLVIELTLNENNQIGVLGAQGKSNGQILMPAQLLPMLIGAFSFVRMLWITFELWRNPDGDISPSLGRHSSHREARTKTKGFNVFGLFSSRLEEIQTEEEQGLHLNTDAKPDEDDTWDDKHGDAYTTLHLRLSLWEKIIITWLPWLSLLYFWPWRKEVPLSPLHQGTETHQLKPRMEPVSLKTPHKTRSTDEVDEEMEGENVDTTYHRPSRVSEIEQYDPHRPRETI